MKRTLASLVMAALVLGAFALNGTGDAQARKPGAPAVAATISLNQTAPTLGDVVTFSYTGVTNDCRRNYGPRCLRIELVCSQAGVPGYVADASVDQLFLLGNNYSAWFTNEGAADCVATLYYYSSYNPVIRVNLAITSFTAAG